MSAYSSVESGLKSAIALAATGFDVLCGVDPAEIDLVEFQKAVVLILEEVTYDPSEELGATRQNENWRWSAYLLAGGGNTADEARTAIFTAIDAIRSGVVGTKPETYCMPLEMAAIRFAGFMGAGCVYKLDLKHTRWTG